MRSHLAARNVYRRCLARHDHHPSLCLPAPALAGASSSCSSPFTTSSAQPRRCTSRPALRATPTLFIPPPPLPLPRTQRRTFLGALRRAPPRELKAQQIEPGYDVLLQFRAATAEDVRRPPRAELVQAFRDFFGYKYQYGKRVNATQAQWMHKLFVYLGEGEAEDIDVGTGVLELSLDDLRVALDALAKPPSDADADRGDHLALCRLLHAEIERRGGATNLDFKRHIGALCQYGASEEAVERLAGYLSKNKDGTTKTALSRRDKELWMTVLAGLAREGREEALLREAAAAEAAGLEYMPLFHETMTTFYAQRGRLAQTQQWFAKPMHGRLLPTVRTYQALLAMAQQTSHKPQSSKPQRLHKQEEETDRATQQWVQATFQALCDANPPKDLWDVIFQWAVAARGKGADEIRRMMATMAKHNGQRPNMAPDAATINGLVEAAAARGDVLLAERFVQLGAELGIAADARTWILQLGYRVAARDLSGAHASFRALLEADCPDEADAAAINGYVRALCAGSQDSAPTAHILRLREVLDALEQRQVALAPATVVALCLAFLLADQQHAVIDVLSVHAMQFSVAERAAVWTALVDYIADRKGTSTARAWDAYSLLRQYFAETPAAARARVMDAFFRRRRADMACYVFGHMRSAADPALRPDAALYVRVLEGLHRCPDAAGLHMVHNMLTMDARVQPDTRLYNALMLAHAAAGSPDRALDVWHGCISTSAEGPSYASLAAVFWACERLPLGDAPARAIWATLQRIEVDVPPAVYDAYVGAIASQGHRAEAQALIGGMVKSAGYGPTELTLAIAHNALPGQDLQAAFAAWAAAEHPDAWLQATKRGYHTTVEGLRRYRVYRDMKA